MRRSSRILCILFLAAAIPGNASARGFGHGGVGVGFGGLGHVGIRLGAAPFAGGSRFAFRPGFRPGGPGLRNGFGRFGRGRGGFGGYGFGGYGFAGDGFDVGAGFGELPYGGVGAPGPGGAPPPRFFPVVHAPPICPLIIAVGRGLRHPAQTRVVYGREPTCRH